MARRGAEEESERAVARWEAALRVGEVDDRVRKEELKAVEKLEVLLKASIIFAVLSERSAAGSGHGCVAKGATPRLTTRNLFFHFFFPAPPGLADYLYREYL